MRWVMAFLFQITLSEFDIQMFLASVFDLFGWCGFYTSVYMQLCEILCRFNNYSIDYK